MRPWNRASIISTSHPASVIAITDPRDVAQRSGATALRNNNLSAGMTARAAVICEFVNAISKPGHKTGTHVAAGARTQPVSGTLLLTHPHGKRQAAFLNGP